MALITLRRCESNVYLIFPGEKLSFGVASLCTWILRFSSHKHVFITLQIATYMNKNIVSNKNNFTRVITSSHSKILYRGDYQIPQNVEKSYSKVKSEKGFSALHYSSDASEEKTLLDIHMPWKVNGTKLEEEVAPHFHADLLKARLREFFLWSFEVKKKALDGSRSKIKNDGT